jgi:hypothetical protein
MYKLKLEENSHAKKKQNNSLGKKKKFEKRLAP